MSDDLVERFGRWLQNTGYDGGVNSPPMLIYALVQEQAAEIRSLRAQVQRLVYDGIHTRHDQCPRLACVQRREIERLREQVAQLEAAYAESEKASDAAWAEGLKAGREQGARAEQFAENANCSERAGIVTWLRGKIAELRAIAEQCDTPHRDAFEAEADAHKSIADAIEAHQDKDTTP